jgi:hypothetical protein
LPKDTYGLLACLFPDDALLPLDEEIFIDEKPDYAFAGDAEKLTGAELMAKFNVGAAPSVRAAPATARRSTRPDHP